MKLTRRGTAVVAVVLLAMVMGAQYGSRALNAIVVPLLVVVAAAVVVVSRSDEPTIERLPVEAGHVGERRTIEFVLTSGRGTTATVVDHLDDGLAATSNRFEITMTDESRVVYDVLLTGRGEWSVGPTTVIVRDLFGLIERRYECDVTEPVMVYPPVYELSRDARTELASFANTAHEFDRAEFDRLREYDRGDSLRDVHWRSVAKRPDEELIVKEFVAEAGLEQVALVAECADGGADDMAAAAATFVDHLLELGVGVVLTVPYDRTVEAGQGGRDVLLRATALADEGTAGGKNRKTADIVIRADETVVVDFGDRSISFEELCAYETVDSTGLGGLQTSDSSLVADPVAGDRTTRNGHGDTPRGDDSTGGRGDSTGGRDDSTGGRGDSRHEEVNA